MALNLDYWRRKIVQDVRDLVFGPYYTLDGVRFRVPRGGVPGPRRALARGTYEAAERALVARWLPPDLPCIELGGSFGIVSNAIRKRIDPALPLLVIEANPKLVDLCAENATRSSGTAMTRVENAALSYPGGGNVEFAVSRNVHSSRLATDGTAGTVTVPARSLSHLVEEAGIDGAFSLVCDIEGAEIQILQDEAALSRCSAIVMELHPTAYRALGTSPDTMEKGLIRLGFRIAERRDDVIAALRGG
jgi:FkbM family methyltransferase